MAPLAPNITSRLFVDYVTGNQNTSQEHTLLCRFTGGSEDVAPAMASVGNFLNALGAPNFRVGWRVIRARVSFAGTDFSVPVELSLGLIEFLGTAPLTGYSPRHETVEDTFQGRSLTTGRRVDISLYRATGDADPSFRIVGGSSGFPLAVTNASNSLNGSSAGGNGFLTLDGSSATWYRYMNQNYNSYWERRIRTV